MSLISFAQKQNFLSIKYKKMFELLRLIKFF